jgi:hypothetical protein
LSGLPAVIVLTIPTGTVSFASDGSGAFSASSCTLVPSGASNAGCSVTYTPSAVGSGTHTITGMYNGDPTHAPSSGNGPVLVSAAATTTTTTTTSVASTSTATSTTAVVTSKTTTTSTTQTASSGVLGSHTVVACSSRRYETVHLLNTQSRRIISAVIYVNGKRLAKITGKLRIAIDMRRLPKRTVTVKIVARTSDGKTITGKRVYHTCHSRLPGSLHLQLGARDGTATH